MDVGSEDTLSTSAATSPTIVGDSEGIGTLVLGLQGITEFMSGVGSKVKKYDPLWYPDNNFEEIVDLAEEPLCGKSYLPISVLQSSKKIVFIPKVPVEVKIIKAEPITSYSNLDYMSSYLYTIRFKHGKFVWEVVRRYRHFHHLHKALIKYVNFVTNSTVHNLIGDRKVDELDIPKLPLPYDLIAGLNSTTVQTRMNDLELYLKAILRYPKFKNHDATKEFLEVSMLSFIIELGPRFKEGLIKKRSYDDVQGRRFFLRLPILCDVCKFRHGEKWFVVKDSYICHIRRETNTLGFPMLFDKGFVCISGFRHTAIQNGMKIANLQRKMYMKTSSDKVLSEWVTAIEIALKTSRCFISGTRYNSFAPVRKQCRGRWFMNGSDYMRAVADGLERAREEIFITDWWLSPEIYMKRPFKNNDKTWRLDHILERKAEQGVHVYVLLYKELKLALTINSLHSKSVLQSRHPYIKVIRHPDPVAATLMWSHHEKSVVIDQEIAFVGGIDLCFGRWDDTNYRLVDLAGANDRKLLSPDALRAKAAAPIEAALDVKRESIIAAAFSSLPEHLMFPDITELGANGDVFQQFGLSDTESEPRREKLTRKWKSVKEAVRSKQFQRSPLEESEESDEETLTAAVSEPEIEIPEAYLWPGKDYSNAYLKDFVEVEKFYEDQLNRKVNQRMPWHDEAAVVFGAAAQDVARHFIQRWNQAKREKFRFSAKHNYLLPKTYCDSDFPDDSWLSDVQQIDVQVLRSVCNWSAGISIIENSIHTAYCDMIKAASHYILIENQFFITSTARNDVVKNGIGNALFDRIMRAHWNNEKFRIYVIVPLLPGFDQKETVKAVQHFSMRSIASGENCLFKKLQQEGDITNPEEYITFYGLRNWDILNGKLVTETIYVHSKLMIVDDKRAIVGSANINDRSLLGSRDSEMALLIEDTEFVPGIMNRKQVNVGKFCSSWRKAIFSQALFGSGTKSKHHIDITDPVCETFYEEFRNIAHVNTETYLEVFGCLPNDIVRDSAALREWTKKEFLHISDPEKALSLLQEKIQGYVVELPLYFIYNENYYPLTKTKEGLAPYIMWT